MAAPFATREQLTAVYRSMSPAQRSGLILCTAAISGWMFWLLARPSSPLLVPALGGRVLTPSEIDQATARLDAAGLAEYEFDDSRLIVPRKAVEEYESIVASDLQTARTWGETWREANSALSDFALSRQREDAGEIARAELLSKLFREMPGIDTAEIVWDEEDRVGWRKPPKVRATVYLKPLEGQVLSPETVSAVRAAVAGSKAHLDSADVAVMDMRSMITYSGDEWFAPNGAPAAAARFTSVCRGRVEHALADIAGVRVSVVMKEPPPSWSASEAAEELPIVASNGRMELPSVNDADDKTTDRAAAREEVSVHVSVPQKYFNALLAQRAAGRRVVGAQLESLRREVEESVVRDVNRRVSAALDGQVNGRSVPTVAVASYRDPPPATEGPVPNQAAYGGSWWNGLLQNDRETAWGLGALIVVFCLLAAFRFAPRLILNRTTSTIPAAPTSSRGEAARRVVEESSTGSKRSTPAAGGETSDGLADVLASLLGEPAGAPTAAQLEPDEQRQTIHEGRFETGEERAEPSGAGAGNSQGNRPPKSGAADSSLLTDSPEPTSLGLSEPRLRTLDAPDGPLVDIDEILRCDPQRLRRLFQQTSSDTWATALVGASPAVQEHLSETLPREDSNRLRRAIHSRRPVRLHDVEFAQREILSGLAIDLA